MTTGASLKPDSASSIPVIRRGSGTRRSTENTAAASVEDRIGADEQRGVPVEVQDEARGERHDGDRDDDADRRQHGRGRDRAADALPPGAQPALAEDEDEGGVAEHLGELVGVEPDAEAGLADGQADAEVDQQRGQPRLAATAAPRRPRRAGRRADQQGRGQVVQGERIPDAPDAAAPPRPAASQVRRTARHVLSLVWCRIVSQGVPRHSCPPHPRGRGSPARRRPRNCRGSRGHVGAPSVPDDRGRDPGAGPAGKVDVIRDDRGIPQIYADTADDLFKAQGFVHAQDRFFEMDLRRHITAGRLSELVGESGLETDRVIRTLGWRRVAEAELPTPQARDPALPPGLRRRGQRLHPRRAAREDVARVRRPRPAGPGLPRRGLDAGRLPRLAQGDGVGPARRLHRRADAGPARRVDVAQPRSTSSTRPTPTPPTSRSCPAQDWSPGVRRRRARGQLRRPVARSRRRRHRRPAAPRPTRPQATAPSDQPGAAAGVCRGAARARRRPRHDGSRRRHRVQLVGRRRRRDEHRQAVAGQRPAPRRRHPGIWYQVGLHCRSVCSTCPFDVAGYSFSGCPASSSATTSRSPGASPTSAPTSATSSSSRCAATPTCATASRCR